MMRSPPPPVAQQQQPVSSYGGMYNAQGSSGGGSFAPNFGGFMNDQTAQMGFQIGKSAVMAGQDYVDQNVGAVSNRGVLMRSIVLVQKGR